MQHRSLPLLSVPLPPVKDEAAGRGEGGKKSGKSAASDCMQLSFEDTYSTQLLPGGTKGNTAYIEWYRLLSLA